MHTAYKKEEEQEKQITESKSRMMMSTAIITAAAVVTLGLAVLSTIATVQIAEAQLPIQIGKITPSDGDEEVDEEQEADSGSSLFIVERIRERATTAGATGSDTVTTEATTISQSLGLTIGETTERGSALLLPGGRGSLAL